jgi:hypothetical protein
MPSLNNFNITTTIAVQKRQVRMWLAIDKSPESVDGKTPNNKSYNKKNKNSRSFHCLAIIRNPILARL